MSAFKAEQRVQYETLLKEEHTLGVQVAAMDANVEAWAQALAAGSSAAPRRRTGKPGSFSLACFFYVYPSIYT